MQDLPLLARAFVLALPREQSPLAMQLIFVRPNGAPHARMSPYVVLAMLRRTALAGPMAPCATGCQRSAKEQQPPRDPITLSPAELRDSLAALDGAVSPAARRPGVSRDQLRRRMEKLGVDPRTYPQAGRDDPDDEDGDARPSLVVSPPDSSLKPLGIAPSQKRKRPGRVAVGRHQVGDASGQFGAGNRAHVRANSAGLEDAFRP